MLAKNIESYRNYTSFVVHGSVLLIRGAQSAISEDQKLAFRRRPRARTLCKILHIIEFATTLVLKRGKDQLRIGLLRMRTKAN